MEQLKVAINTSLELGYRHIDTAFLYGNEAVIGNVLTEWFTSGKLKREDIFITTKLPSQGVHAELVENYLKQSLEALQLEYVDLYLIHSPVYRKKDELSGNFVEADTDHIAVWKVSNITKHLKILRLSIVAPSFSEIVI